MKRTLVFTLLLSSLTMMAQQNPERKGRPMIKVSAEDMAQVQSKQLTLALVLNEKQEKQVYNLEPRSRQRNESFYGKTSRG